MEVSRNILNVTIVFNEYWKIATSVNVIVDLLRDSRHVGCMLTHPMPCLNQEPMSLFWLSGSVYLCILKGFVDVVLAMVHFFHYFSCLILGQPKQQLFFMANSGTFTCRIMRQQYACTCIYLTLALGCNCFVAFTCEELSTAQKVSTICDETWLPVQYIAPFILALLIRDKTITY